MHYLKTGLLIAALGGESHPKKRISNILWPQSRRAIGNLLQLFKRVIETKEAHIQAFCDEFDLVITFSKDNEPKVKKND